MGVAERDPMRKLKYHEERLLRKVNFLDWKSTNTKREHLITAKYNLVERDEYVKYNKFSGKVKNSRWHLRSYTKRTE